MSTNEELLNSYFVERVETHEGREKLAELGSNYIRDRLREESFTRKLLPPKTVTRKDLQVSVNHDTLVKIVEVAPDSRAMTMSFRGEPTAKYIRAPRFEVPFHTVGSERYEKTEQELMAYIMPITQIIKQQVVMDIQEVEDYTFLTHAESAVQSLQKQAEGVAYTANFTGETAFTAKNVNAGTVLEVGKCKANDVLFQADSGAAGNGEQEALTVALQKDDLVKLFKLFPGNGTNASRLKADRFLLTDNDFEDINTWTNSEVGEKIAGETTVDGFKYKTLVGRKYIRTLKTDILRPGNIYAFTEPKYYGGFLVLNKVKFFADKERNRISWEAWEDIGMYIGNVAGGRKLELYAGSTDAGITGVQASGVWGAGFAPVAESEIGKRNNLVDEDQVFPQVSGF